MIEVGHGTHPGLLRDNNEDTYQADSDAGLWLVADGMGGHQHGEVASALARDTIVEEIHAGHSLAQAIRTADDAIMAHASGWRDILPMGTTVAALRLWDRQYQIAWVGDSRIYLMDQTLQQLSSDHSLVRQLVDRGTLSEQEARRHPRRNEITQALGITPAEILQVACLDGDLHPGTQFLLCSDGLTEEVSHDRIEAILGRHELTAQECVDQLIAAALEAGGKDNITVVLVRIQG